MMDSKPLIDSFIAAAALSGTILILGAAFLLLLRTSKFQYSLRFLMLSIVSIAAVIGLWTALLSRSVGSRLTGPGTEIDTESPTHESLTPNGPPTGPLIDPSSQPLNREPVDPAR